ncbi:MAG: hypothetical protein COT38_03905 [Candidatus Omnitrophica bacterium CG08_land_8_20_14_0_20_41_16]|uniref:TonB-dependent receptor plug domain-containing protein n=1 Tax=Candidatus Sherwoodlollariibacterium unditelluris TaxID=1974757 RepID=A0A2G9YLB9_9BACT|nr:MAG: hypothetical protein COX41_02485 [Candidatus Omnitrophica bacterium CG23_combo_of_CG06-09_8_20_14_all_41_10]PIS33708.1 MAG: hypothetical protein COT38_03905 [Candidatus Omnitrophica bacterium CG08_land_8_20_14_0_20_41_16]
MHKIKSCGLVFIIIILAGANPVFAEESEPADLDKIVVTKHSLYPVRNIPESRQDNEISNRVYLEEPYSLNSGELESLPFSSSVEALSTLPIDLQSRQPHNGIQTDFSLRGSTFQGVLLLLNGQRINDPQTGHHNADIPFTQEDINKIEVMPGVGSSLFGPDAIGGAVNFILKRPQERKFILESSGGQHGSFSGLISAQAIK